MIRVATSPSRRAHSSQPAARRVRVSRIAATVRRWSVVGFVILKSLAAIAVKLLTPYARVVSSSGWLVLTVGATCLIASAILGWVELFFLGVTLLAALLVSVGFVFGRATYSVHIELNPRRVVVGDKALGSMVVSNSGAKKLLATRMELP